MAAWHLVTRTKSEGGLGVKKISTHNGALLRKTCIIFNHHSIPWVQLLWENYYTGNILPGQRKGGSFGGEIF